MALVTINSPDPSILHTPTNKVSPSDINEVVSEFQKLSFPLRPGSIGIAANQVGMSDSIFVAWINNSHWRFFINPNIVEAEGLVMSHESCLSIPDTDVKVERHNSIKLEWLDVRGAERSGKFYHFSNPSIQHEIDHLDGILITDEIHKQWKEEQEQEDWDNAH